MDKMAAICRVCGDPFTHGDEVAPYCCGEECQRVLERRRKNETREMTRFGSCPLCEQILTERKIRKVRRTAESKAVKDAMAFLEGMLSRGPVDNKAVRAAAASENISPASLKRAKRALGVEFVVTHAANSRRNVWAWALPAGKQKLASEKADRFNPTKSINGQFDDLKSS